MTDHKIVIPVDQREKTIFETDKGEIHVIHEITLGDLLVSTSLAILIIVMFLSRVIRRSKNV